jgi:hypothetical protein
MVQVSQRYHGIRWLHGEFTVRYIIWAGYTTLLFCMVRRSMFLEVDHLDVLVPIHLIVLDVT